MDTDATQPGTTHGKQPLINPSLPAVAPKDRLAEIDRHIGHRLFLRRCQLGLSQRQLAGVTEFTFQQIQKFEGGESRISPGQLLALAQALRVPISYFFEDVDSERGCMETTARLAEAMRRVAEMDRLHRTVMEEVGKESPECAERILLRLSQVSRDWGG